MSKKDMYKVLHMFKNKNLLKYLQFFVNFRVISYKSLCELAHRDFSILNKFVDIQIVYGRDDKPENFDIKNWCNSEGIVAYGYPAPDALWMV
jgi:hypothetical protein